MLTEERYAKILSILENTGSVTVQQLMTELDTSESTIRRDLTALDASGQLTKVHGGAILKNTVYSTQDDKVTHCKEQNKDAKEKIARHAASLITPGDFVYIDAADESKFNQISSVTFAPFESATVITTGLTQPAFKNCQNIVNI